MWFGLGLGMWFGLRLVLLLGCRPGLEQLLQPTPHGSAVTRDLVERDGEGVLINLVNVQPLDAFHQSVHLVGDLSHSDVVISGRFLQVLDQRQ